MDYFANPGPAIGLTSGGNNLSTIGLGVQANNYFNGAAAGDFNIRAANGQRLNLGVSNTNGTSNPSITLTSNGNVGIGTTAPASLLSAGSSSQFQVNSSGDLARINNVFYNWPSAQGAANQVLTNNGSGTLTWTTIASGGSSGTTTTYLSVVGSGDGSSTAAGGTLRGANITGTKSWRHFCWWWWWWSRRCDL